jgi:hypothetical protein
MHQEGGMADFTGAAPPMDRPRDSRDSAWFRIAIVVAVVILGTVAVTRFLKHDVVGNWQLLATCPAASDAAAVPVATTLDTQACSSDPIDPHDGRGWPIVAFVLPADVGLSPSITTVHADNDNGRMWLDYVAPAPGDGRNSGETVLVFVEVPSSSLPDVPFTGDGATGSVTVTAVPAG